MVANLLGRHRTSATVVARPTGVPATPSPSPTPTVVCEGCGEKGSCHSLCEEGELKWEALKLMLSQDDVAKNVELESVLVQDLVLRHQNHLRLLKI